MVALLLPVAEVSTAQLAAAPPFLAAGRRRAAWLLALVGLVALGFVLDIALGSVRIPLAAVV